MTDQTIKHLDELLEQKEWENERLRSEIRKKEEIIRSDVEWTRHRDLDTDEYPELPVPRLQMKWVEEFYPGSDSDEEPCFSHWHVEYGLMYRHLLKHMVFVPLGSTTMRGSRGKSPMMADGKINTPFRDGVHILSDSHSLNLPAFVCWKNHVYDLAPDVAEFARRRGLNK